MKLDTTEFTYADNGTFAGTVSLNSVISHAYGNDGAFCNIVDDTAECIEDKLESQLPKGTYLTQKESDTIAELFREKGVYELSIVDNKLKVVAQISAP